ncbi:MAG: antibiotic biosynthesis monooxygenase [Desulfobacter sp.]|nr:antibiotic biosynthesis monooxygenase [Desulfobacter sp.]WDP85101.1 MAG: antibiotic biosynthesis monooxygenase [Desulfobacter sp.]
MIAVRIILDVLPEKQLEVMQTLFSLIKPVGKEQGCKSYKVYCDIKDKNSFCLFEEWETREDLDYHIKTFRFKVLLGTKTLLRKPPEIRIYTVSRTQGMEAVEAIRIKDV